MVAQACPDQLFPTPAGTPQGGIISPILANLALDGLEEAVKAVARKGDKVHFVRSCMVGMLKGRILPLDLGMYCLRNGNGLYP